ncbi:MAG: hypothetical protein WCO02_13425 [Bacteroidota bacterium]
MGIDIKIPIGLMFTILGLLLTVYGFITRLDASLYTPSLGININLWSGAGMLVFGIFMLALGLKSRKFKS